MPSNNIYTWNNGVYDYSRWLSLSFRGAETCIFQLSELCLPGEPSRLATVSCPTSYVKSVLVKGGMQITLTSGYFLISHEDNEIQIDFRGLDDAAPIRSRFKADDLLASFKANEETSRMALTG